MRPAFRLSALTSLAATLAAGCLFSGVDVPLTDDAAARTFALQAPRRVSPREDQAVAPDFARLAWVTVPGADQYELFVGQDTNPPLTARIAGTDFILRDLPECATLYWRVVARRGEQFVSSPTWTFQTRCR